MPDSWLPVGALQVVEEAQVQVGVLRRQVCSGGDGVDRLDLVAARPHFSGGDAEGLVVEVGAQHARLADLENGCVEMQARVRELRLDAGFLLVAALRRKALGLRCDASKLRRHTRVVDNFELAWDIFPHE